MWQTSFSDLVNALSPVGSAAVTYGVFRVLDRDASKPAKTAVSSWIENTEYDYSDLRRALVGTFDRIYSSPLLRPKAFLRSFVISAFSVYVAVVFAENNGAFFNPVFMAWLLITPVHAQAVLLHSVIVSDYISLFVIRYWLNRLGHRLLTGLVGAALIGIIIVISIMASFAMLECFMVGCNALQAWTLFQVEWYEYSGSRSVIVGFIVYAWLILFALGAVVLRSFNTLLRVLRLAHWFHGRGHPLRAIGYVAATIVFVVVAISRGALSVLQVVSQ
jgi:hypothetical protein